MKRARTCAECGRELPPGAPDGLCPACLLGIGAAELGIGAEHSPKQAQPKGAGIASDAAAVGGAEASAPGVKAGLRLGDYELLERIGQGGMGVVVKARQTTLGRVVALKLLPFGQFTRQDALDRFRAEASAAAGLQHPNIVAIHEVGEHEGQPYFSMDYVEGQTLADLVRDQPLSPQRAATYLKTIAVAVHYAHQHGILHRDLKPANVMIDGNDQPRITDFGLAKRLDDSALSTLHSPPTLTGQVLGSPNFMSPEQAEGRHKEVGPACDVYGLGGLLYHLLTRQPPFQADTLTVLLKQVIENEPLSPRLVNPSVPRDLETICLKCLEKDRARRYPTAQAVADDLGRFLEGKPISARPVGALGKSWKWCRRRPVLAGLGAGLLISLLAGAMGVLWQLHQTRLAKLMAERREYAGNVALVQGLINGKQFDRATEILNLRTPEQFRGWEWGWLQRQCNQDLMTLPGAGSTFAVFSPDSRLLATGGFYGNAISLWDLATGQQVRTFLGNTQVVGQVAFSPDGRQLAGTGWWERTVRIWEVASARQLRCLTHPDGVYFISYSPDGKKMASTCWDGKVRIWDTGNGQIVAESPQYGDELYCAEFSPDGRRIAYGGGYYRFARSLENSVCIWDLASGEVKRMKGHSQSVFRTVWSPKGDLLASVGWDGLVKLWDPESALAITNLTSSASPGCLLSAAFSPDGRRLLVAGGETQTWTARLEVYDVPTRQFLYLLDGHAKSLCGVHFSPDGRLIASAAGDNTVKVWAAEPAPTYLVCEGHDQTVWTVAFSPDGAYLATGSLDLTAKIWNATNGTLVQTIPVNFPVVALAFNPEGNRLLTVGPNDTACVWKLTTSRQPVVPGTSTPITPGASPDEPLRLRGHQGSVMAVAWSSDNRWTATGGRDKQVILREASSGRECRRLSGHTEAILALTFSPRTPLLASGSEDATVRLWNPESGRCVQVVTNHGRPILSLAFSPDGRLLASGGEDGRARLWDTGDWRELHALPVSMNGPTGLAFSPDGRRLATAGGGRDLVADWSRECRIRLWDVVLGQELLAFIPHPNAVYGVAFSPDGRQLATTSGDNTARLWTGFPWKSGDYPGGPREALADRIETFKRRWWRPAQQAGSNPARHIESQALGHFNLPAPGTKTRPVFPIPPRGPRTTLAQLDLTHCYNVALNESWQPLDGAYEVGRNLATLNPGLQTVAGVDFDVRGIVQLRRAAPDCQLFPMQIWIPADRMFRHLHALQGTRWVVREGLPVAAFVLHYADGTQDELPIVYGLHLRHEDVGTDLGNVSPEAAVATAAPRVERRQPRQPRLYKTTLINPHPDREVHQIEYISKVTQSAPFLLAVTVE